MSDILNPDDVNALISATRNDIASDVTTVSNAEAKAKEARRIFDRAYAKAFVDAEGSAYLRRYKATIATMDEREAAEIAELAFTHAEREAWSRIRGLGALQTISNSVMTLYGSVRA